MFKNMPIRDPLHRPKIWMFSDAMRLPDWQSAISRQPRHVGLLLRDYEHVQRAALAADMAALCRRQGRGFAIAGDRRLALAHRAMFHCPSYLLARPAARLGPPAPGDTAAVHDMAQLRRAQMAGFTAIFVSPIFATDSHRGANGLGPIKALPLLRAARQAGLQAYALGGMNDQGFRRLGGSKTANGWAAIAAFG